MTVKELVKNLMHYNPQAEVIFSYYINNEQTAACHGVFDLRKFMIVNHSGTGKNMIEIYNADVLKRGDPNE